MVISLFRVIGHPDGSSIDFCVKCHFYIIPVQCRVVVINVLRDVVLLGLDLHDWLHLCGVDSDIRIIVGVLSAVVCLVLLNVIWTTGVRVCVVRSVGAFAHSLRVCFHIVHTSVPTVLGLILFTLMLGDQ